MPASELVLLLSLLLLLSETLSSVMLPPPEVSVEELFEFSVEELFKLWEELVFVYFLEECILQYSAGPVPFAKYSVVVGQPLFASFPELLQTVASKTESGAGKPISSV